MTLGENKREPAAFLSRTEATIGLAGLAFVLADGLFAQRIPLDTGFHWDGTYYLAYARDIAGPIIGGELDQYSITRVVPSALVHLGLRVTGAALDQFNIVAGFVVLNALLVAASLAGWFAIVRLLAFNRFQLVLGSAAFFLNFCFLKYNPYYPFTTDVTAFFISIWMAFFYLSNRRVLLVLATVVGAFCWPVIIYTGCLLIAFPRRDGMPGPTAAPEPSGRLIRIVGLSTGAVAAAVAVVVHYALAYRHPGAITVESMAPLSILIVGLYASMFARLFLLLCRDVVADLRRRPSKLLASVAVALVAFAVVKLTVWLLAKEGSRNPFDFYVLATMAIALKYPGVSLIAHFAFFGPAVLLIAAKWRRVVSLGAGLGSGWAAAMLLTGMLGVSSESRTLMANAVFLIVPAIASIRLVERPHLFMTAWAAISLVVSRVWLTLDPTSLVFEYAAYLEFPWQWFFGATGWWMNPVSYLLALCAFAIAAVALLPMMRSDGSTLGDRKAATVG